MRAVCADACWRGRIGSAAVTADGWRRGSAALRFVAHGSRARPRALTRTGPRRARERSRARASAAEMGAGEARAPLVALVMGRARRARRGESRLPWGQGRFPKRRKARDLVSIPRSPRPRRNQDQAAERVARQATSGCRREHLAEPRGGPLSARWRSPAPLRDGRGEHERVHHRAARRQDPRLHHRPAARVDVRSHAPLTELPLECADRTRSCHSVSEPIQHRAHLVELDVEQGEILARDVAAGWCCGR